MPKELLDTQKALLRLEEQHKTLKERVAILDRRAFLTPQEQHEATKLKKRKLAAKDAMAGLRAQLSN